MCNFPSCLFVCFSFTFPQSFSGKQIQGIDYYCLYGFSEQLFWGLGVLFISLLPLRVQTNWKLTQEARGDEGLIFLKSIIPLLEYLFFDLFFLPHILYVFYVFLNGPLHVIICSSLSSQMMKKSIMLEPPWHLDLAPWPVGSRLHWHSKSTSRMKDGRLEFHELFSRHLSLSV